MKQPLFLKERAEGFFSQVVLKLSDLKIRLKYKLAISNGTNEILKQMLNKTWRTSNAKKGMSSNPGERPNFKYQSQWQKKLWAKSDSNVDYAPVCSPPWNFWVSYPALYGSPKYQPKTNWVLGFSSAKMDLFGISRGLQFWNLQLWWAMYKFVLMVREGDDFYRGEKKLRGF